jgi:hypothetical protein
VDSVLQAASEWACQQTVLCFSGYFDSGEFDAMAEYFAPDGVWHRLDGTIRGRGELLQAMAARPKNRFIRHVITNLRVWLTEPGEAVCRSYVTVYRHDAEPVLPLPLDSPVLIGSYLDKLRLINGRWLISERSVTVELTRKKLSEGR